MVGKTEIEGIRSGKTRRVSREESESSPTEMGDNPRKKNINSQKSHAGGGSSEKLKEGKKKTRRKRKKTTVGRGKRKLGLIAARNTEPSKRWG